MTDEYTPGRGTVRYRYVQGDYSGGNRNPNEEFDRFIANERAEAVREFVRSARDLLDSSGDTRWKARALEYADRIERDV